MAKVTLKKSIYGVEKFENLKNITTDSKSSKKTAFEQIFLTFESNKN